MSEGKLARDLTGQMIQAVELPITGKTTNISSAVGNSASATLEAGLYRITTTIDARICAGTTAAATDMPITIGSVEYLYINGTALATYCAATGGTISVTKV